MDNFLQSMKENLENRPEADFRETSWQTMEQRIREQQAPNRERRITPWYLPLLFGFLLSSLLFNYYLYQQLAPVEKSPTSASVTIIKDTLIHTKVIYITDTIYQPRSPEQALPQTATPALLAFTSPYLTTERAAVFPHTLTTPLIDLPPGTKAYFSSLALSTPNTKGKVLEAIPQPLAITKQLADKKINLPEKALTAKMNGLPLAITKRRKSISEKLYLMRPRTFRLGVQAGFLTSFYPDTDGQGGNISGLAATIGFARPWQLFTSVNYIRSSYETDRMDPSLGIPLVSPPGDDLIFQKANLSQTAFQYNIGLQYLFNQGRQIRPLLGLGYSISSLQPKEVVYEFEHPDTQAEVNLDLNFPNRQLLYNQLLFKVGIEWNLHKNWYVQMNSFYRQQLSRRNIDSPGILGLQAGLHYQF